jgi:hypothetical protein
LVHGPEYSELLLKRKHIPQADDLPMLGFLAGGDAHLLEIGLVVRRKRGVDYRRDKP